jgi:putative membrane protein
MKIVAWIIRLVLFALLFILALRNTTEVSLQLFADVVWHAPLILILLVAFGLGIVATLLAAAPAMMRHRMEAGRLRRALNESRSGSAAHGADMPSQPAKATVPYTAIGPKV